MANFLLHSGFRQVKPRSRVLSGLGFLLPKLIFGHVDYGFLNHSSAADTFPNIYAASSSFVELDNLCQPSEGPVGTVFWLIRSFYKLTFRGLSASIVLVLQCCLFKWQRLISAQFSLRNQQPRVIRLPALNTADSFQSSVRACYL